MNSKSSVRAVHSIIVKAQSEAWCSLISRKFGGDARRNALQSAPQPKLSWLLNTNELLSAAIKNRATIAIVEISTSNVQRICLDLAPLANNSYQLKLFAIGDHGLARWQPVLRAAGFAGTYWSLLQSQELIRAIEAHQLNTPTQFLRVEDRISALLPWRAAKTDQP